MAQSGIPRSYGALPYGRAAFAASELAAKAATVEANPHWRGRYQASVLRRNPRLWQQPAGDGNDVPASQILLVGYTAPPYPSATASRLYYWRRDIVEGPGAAPVAAAAPAYIEVTLDRRTDLPGQTESLGSARDDGTGPIALLLTARNDPRLPFGFPASVRGDAANPVEIPARVQWGPFIPIEWSGGVVIGADAPGPLEWVASGGSVVINAGVEVEWAATPVLLISAERILASPGRRRRLTAPVGAQTLERQ